MTRPNVTTWANGFGVWHARVSRHAASPLIAARRALRDELQARESASAPVAREVWMRPIRAPDLDTAETIVYREGNVDGHVNHAGTSYWPTYEAARQWARLNSYPTDRIIHYARGWAIQLRVSGPYILD